MQIVQLAFHAIAPTFLFILIGYLCKCVGLVKESEQPRMNSIGFKIFLPVTLFHQIYSSRISWDQGIPVLVFASVAMLAVFGVTTFFVLRLQKNPQRRGVMIQAVFRSNYVLLGMPIVTALHPGAAAVAALMAAVIVPLFNVMAVIALEAFNGKNVKIRPLLAEIARNPLIIASLIGIFFMATGIRLPYMVENVSSKLAAVATPYLLFWLGAFFRIRFRFDKALFWCLLSRLIIVPAVILPAAALLGFRGGEFATLMAVFAAPPATSSFTMAQQLGGDAELAGNCVVLSSVVSFFTILMWMCLYLSLGIL